MDAEAVPIVETKARNVCVRKQFRKRKRFRPRMRKREVWTRERFRAWMHKREVRDVEAVLDAEVVLSMDAKARDGWMQKRLRA